jgi:TPP-dependent pyruvate/acetoin dehydrogenase alpha subunit
MSRCPIDFLSKDLIGNGILTNDEYVKMKENIKLQIDKAVVFAKKSPAPDPLTIMEGLFK